MSTAHSLRRVQPSVGSGRVMYTAGRVYKSTYDFYTTFIDQHHCEVTEELNPEPMVNNWWSQYVIKLFVHSLELPKVAWCASGTSHNFPLTRAKIARNACANIENVMDCALVGVSIYHVFKLSFWHDH